MYLVFKYRMRKRRKAKRKEKKKNKKKKREKVGLVCLSFSGLDENTKKFGSTG